jgi:hypothetical protein
MMMTTCLASSKLKEGANCDSVTVEVTVPPDVITATFTLPVVVSSGIWKLDTRACCLLCNQAARSHCDLIEHVKSGASRSASIAASSQLSSVSDRIDVLIECDFADPVIAPVRDVEAAARIDSDKHRPVQAGCGRRTTVTRIVGRTAARDRRNRSIA